MLKLPKNITRQKRVPEGTFGELYFVPLLRINDAEIRDSVAQIISSQNQAPESTFGQICF